MVTNSIQKAQGAVEAQNYEIRKNVLKYDDVMNRQRQVIYDERRAVLEGEDLHEQLRHVRQRRRRLLRRRGDRRGLRRRLGPRAALGRAAPGLPGRRSPSRRSRTWPAVARPITPDLLREQLMSDAHHAYDRREESLGEETMREVERRVVLSVLDRKWREHLYEMDYLQEGIGLRAMAQRDPLIEYQREGFQLFEAMMEAIKEESVAYLFSVEVQVTPTAPSAPAGSGVAPMAVGDLVGGLADAVTSADGQVRERAPTSADADRTSRRGATGGRRVVGANVRVRDGVQVTGVDLPTGAALRPRCTTRRPARTAAPSSPAASRPVERRRRAAARRSSAAAADAAHAGTGPVHRRCRARWRQRGGIRAVGGAIVSRSSAAVTSQRPSSPSSRMARARTRPWDTTTAQASTMPSAGSQTRIRRTTARRAGPRRPGAGPTTRDRRAMTE